MPDKIERLRKSLRELHEELDQVESLDDEGRLLIEQAKGDLDDALHRDDTAAMKHHSIRDRLLEAQRQFEDSHPVLARTVGNVLDVLGQIGI